MECSQWSIFVDMYIQQLGERAREEDHRDHGDDDLERNVTKAVGRY